MPKINQEEYEVLKDLKGFGYLYITRDTRNNIYLFDEIPVKHENKFWLSAQFGDTGVFKPSYVDMFPFIQWEDDEPHNIAELIKEYEYSTEHVSHVVNERVRMLGKAWSESEETEVKNLEWLKGRFSGRKIFKPQNDREIGYNMAIDEFSEYVDQLDEPEITLNEAFNKLEETHILSKEEIVKHFEQLEIHNGKVTYGDYETLSQEWIDGHTYYEDEYDFYYADPDELKNLLVPKQEEKDMQDYWKEATEFLVHERVFGYEGRDYIVVEKPTIPQFVADILEENTFADLPTAFEELFSANAGHYYGEDVCKWIVSNEETFARAWLDGYEVEEQKYYVLTSTNKIMLTKDDGEVQETYQAYSWIKKRDKECYQLTEQEIKDYDERYWAFAVKVEELEE